MKSLNLNLLKRNNSLDLNNISYFNNFAIFSEDNDDNNSMLDLYINNGKPFPPSNTFNAFETTFKTTFCPHNDLFSEEPNDCNNILYLKKDNINNDDNNDETIIKENEKIFTIKKVPHRGRKRKNCTKKGKHNNKSIDNGIKSLINSSTSNAICPFLQKILKNFAKKHRKRGFLIGPFKSNKYLKEGYKKINQFFDTSVKELLFDVNTVASSNNENKINEFLEYEINNDKIELKELNMLFNASYKTYLKPILDDKKFVYIDGVKFDLGDDFKTLKDLFSTGNKIYTDEDKNKFKSHIYKIMNKEVHTRKGRKAKKY